MKELSWPQDGKCKNTEVNTEQHKLWARHYFTFFLEKQKPVAPVNDPNMGKSTAKRQ